MARSAPGLPARDAMAHAGQAGPGGAAGWPDLEAVLGPLAEASCLPPACYSSPDFLEIEQRRVLGSAWASLGRGDRLAGPGAYAAVELAGVPLLLLRDRAGSLGVFANACRHRGTKLLEGSGQCRSVTCPFHGWVYGLDGKLLKAPAMEEAAVFALEDYPLVPVRHGERDGFIFVNLDGAAPPLDDWLGDFAALHAPWQLAALKTARRREFEVACNWKLFLEVFNEYYHLKYVHPRSIGTIYHEPRAPEEVTGQFVTQFGTHERTSGLLAEDEAMALPPFAGLSAEARAGTRYSWVFPNLAFALSAEAMWAYDVTPLGADRTWVGMTCAFAEEAAQLADFDDRAAAYMRRMDRAIAEDIEVLELQQAGLSSPLARSGPFSRLEPNVRQFARWIAGRCRS